jgi:hypothetical protein
MSMVLSAKFGALVFPFIIIAGATGWLQMYALQQVEKIQEEPQKTISTTINDVVDAINTIAILGQEEEVIRSIAACTAYPRSLHKWQSVNHITQALGESIAFAVPALLNWCVVCS